jgi:hypothetical protein
MGASVREVMEYTYLEQWLLKKGAMLQMPSRIIHQDADLWGPDLDGIQYPVVTADLIAVAAVTVAMFL